MARLPPNIPIEFETNGLNLLALENSVRSDSHMLSTHLHSLSVFLLVSLKKRNHRYAACICARVVNKYIHHQHVSEKNIIKCSMSVLFCYKFLLCANLAAGG